MSSMAGVEPALDVLETSAPTSSIDDNNHTAKTVPKSLSKIQNYIYHIAINNYFHRINRL